MFPRFRLFALAALVAFIPGCPSAEPSRPLDARARADASPILPDAGPPTACAPTLYTKRSCGAHPTGTAGAAIGQVFPAFDPGLRDCNLDRLKLRDLTCGAELLLFNVAAGWCKPCIEEAKVIEAKIHRRFCSRGLRIVMALFQDDRSQIPTSVFCEKWRDTYQLKFPVLLDQLQASKGLFGTRAVEFPLNILIDAKTMKVLRRWQGKVPDDLDAAIEAELKKRGK